MAKISSYGNIIAPVLTDQLIGTDVGGTPADTTKNFLLSDIQTLFKTSNVVTLSDVLTAGNTATANIVLTGDISATNLAVLLAITGTTITATGGVYCDALIATTIATAPTITASGTITGATVTATGTVNATTVAATGVVSASQIKVTSITPIFATNLLITGLPIYANQGAAVTGGLATNGIYKTVTGELRIVV
jgi:hypothetical protein